MEWTAERKKVRLAMLCMARQCWEQGMAAQALLETGDLEAMELMARDCAVRQAGDGRLCVVEETPALVDPAICVEPVLRAAQASGDEALRKAALLNIEYLRTAAPRTADGACYQLFGGCEIWADSLGMGPHALALGGYAAEAVALYEAVKRRLYDRETGLFRHKWDEARGAFSRPCLWGVGNGWALTGLMRMAEIFQRQARPEADWAAREFAALYAAILPWQDESGAFHDVLNDPGTFLETEFTEMFAYSTLKMVSLGMLQKTALESALRARAYAASRVDARGMIHGCAGSPTFEKEGTSAECQAHYLMMEAACEALGIK